MIATIAWGALAGLLGTVTMDASATLTRKLGITQGLEPRIFGRWFRSVAALRPFHRDIYASPSVAGEFPTAAVGHFSIGITFGVIWALIAHHIASPVGRVAGGIGFGLATNAAPWLLMFPAMGFGFFGLRGPAEKKLFVTSFLNHLAYGIALGVLSLVLPF